MKSRIYFLLLLLLFINCKGTQVSDVKSAVVSVAIDLVNVENDRVKVRMDFPPISGSTAVFCIPKTVPGTYSTDNYGQFIENLKAFDKNGNEISCARLDTNRWEIAVPSALHQLTYEVNDSYDIVKEGGVFSPAGTNIEKDSNFMLNLYAFVGYIPELEKVRYQLHVQRPDGFYPGTALHFTSSKLNNGIAEDIFELDRYFEVTDNPILYALPDTLSFRTGGMQILLALHSASGRYTAKDIEPALVKTMKAQKNFLGEIDNTDKYAVLLYLADDSRPDARGAGALEHNNSTVVVFSENISPDNLQQAIVDVVSHEFFHILTPLNIHSHEIHDFDFIDPKMSKHLWLYEGVTEYFAQLFQVNQGLCSEPEFFERMADKINVSKLFDDTVPFTVMSQYILTDDHKDSFYNVYQKGALIAMCLDLELRELSDGESGILELMQRLSKKYGKDQPFDDDKIVDEIVTMTYPEIRAFFEMYVYGENPIPYGKYLGKVGLQVQEELVGTDYLFQNNIPFIDLHTDTGEIYFRKRTNLNSFLINMGVQGGDILKAINGTPITTENYRAPILATRQWMPGMDVSFLVERNGEEILLTGVTEKPTVSVRKITEKTNPENNGALQLRSAWLKG